MCAEGKLCVSKRAPTLAPGATKEPFFALSMASINAGRSASGGDVGLPEMAHRDGH